MKDAVVLFFFFLSNVAVKLLRYFKIVSFYAADGVKK